MKIQWSNLILYFLITLSNEKKVQRNQKCVYVYIGKILIKENYGRKKYIHQIAKKIIIWVAFSSKCTYIQNTNFALNFHAVNKIYCH